MTWPIRRDCHSVFRLQRLCHELLSPQTVHFEISSIGNSSEQVYMNFVGAVRGHRQSVRFGQMGDLHPRCNAAAGGEVRLREINAFLLNQHRKFGHSMQILSSSNGHTAVCTKTCVTSIVVRANGLLYPYEIEWLQRMERILTST